MNIKNMTDAEIQAQIEALKIEQKRRKDVESAFQVISYLDLEQMQMLASMLESRIDARLKTKTLQKEFDSLNISPTLPR